MENMVLSSEEVARATRLSVLQMTTRARAAHTGASLSVVDILSVIFSEFVRPKGQTAITNHIYISKGHASAATYASMAHSGFFPTSKLTDFCEDGSDLGGHVTKSPITGVELSTGSLGHALPYAVGVALSNRMDGTPSHTFVVLSDGELDEGSNWEAALFASHHDLANLVVVIDRNRMQSLGSTEDTVQLEPLADKWKSFGWAVLEVDGHDHSQLRIALETACGTKNKPTVVIGNTIKGKGVSFMENNILWHYRPPSEQDLHLAIAELRSSGL